MSDELVRVLNRLGVEFDDHIVDLQAGFRRRRRLTISIRLNVCNDRALGIR